MRSDERYLPGQRVRRRACGGTGRVDICDVSGEDFISSVVLGVFTRCASAF